MKMHRQRAKIFLLQFTSLISLDQWVYHWSKPIRAMGLNHCSKPQQWFRAWQGGSCQETAAFWDFLVMASFETDWYQKLCPPSAFLEKAEGPAGIMPLPPGPHSHKQL